MLHSVDAHVLDKVTGLLKQNLHDHRVFPDMGVSGEDTLAYDLIKEPCTRCGACVCPWPDSCIHLSRKRSKCGIGPPEKLYGLRLGRDLWQEM